MDADTRRLATFAAVTVLVVTSSLVPAPATPDRASPGGAVPLPSGTDKLLHGVGYAAVAYTLGRSLPSGRRRGANGPSTVALVGVVAVATAIGAGVEVAQGGVPGRDPSLLDGVANAVGALVGAAWWRRRDRDSDA
ncbi:VanZ family protein [Halobaculum roseum]|uniref:VanZ like family protein n=1 Tax=Halobaculum roseum TaxID=2175149 RepID=A0ABD5MQ89_9EURY|nr:antibiotic resistance protein VanZ [Halobaculum roseum]QZY03890.1 antibiotic resistance protein VanZ [Halobaculum roseum]